MHSTGFRYGQDSLNESAAGSALCSEAQLPINYGWPEGAFGSVVRGFDAFDFCKGPQPLAAGMELCTHAVQLIVATESTAQQQAIELGANRRDRFAKGIPGNLFGFVQPPLLEQEALLSHQVVAESLDLTVGTIN